MDKIITFIKDWMLPISIFFGVGAYLLYYFIPALHPLGPVGNVIVSKGQPVMISLMLFLQFVKVSPHDLRFHRWNIVPLLLQVSGLVAFALLAANAPSENARILYECAMLCFICPTACAAGVITEKLGGSLQHSISYVVIINCVATVLIPAIIPLVHPETHATFFGTVTRIAMKIFPILIMPCLLAWVVRYTMRRLQRYLMRKTQWAFYLWALSLGFAIILATKALVHSRLSFPMIIGVCLVSLGSCIVQFLVGRISGQHFGDSERVTSGQSLGQKNTGFLIWLGYNYMTPVTSISGGLYAIWQNIFNAWQLYCRRHGK